MNVRLRAVPVAISLHVVADFAPTKMGARDLASSVFGSRAPSIHPLTQLHSLTASSTMSEQANSAPTKLADTLAAALDLGDEGGTSEEERSLLVKTLVCTLV